MLRTLGGRPKSGTKKNFFLRTNNHLSSTVPMHFLHRSARAPMPFTREAPQVKVISDFKNGPPQN